MKKFLTVIILSLLWNGNIHPDTQITKRTEKEIKLGVFKEDLKTLNYE